MPMPIMPNGKNANEERPTTQDTINVDVLNYQGQSKMFDYAMGNNITNKNANNLFAIWDSKDNIISEAATKVKGSKDDIFRVPNTMSHSDVLALKSAGLIDGGDKTVRITDKGAEIIRKMVLFGEESSFESDNKMPSYSEIERKIKANLQKKSSKKKG